MPDHEEPLLRAIFRRCYLSVAGQFLILLVLVALTVWVYFCTHHRWESAYWQHIKPVIQAGLRGFSVGLDAKGEHYQLQQNGQPIKPGAPLAKMTFGLEKTASVTGVLTQYGDAVDAARQVLDARENTFRSAFIPQENTARVLRLTSLGVAGSGAEFRLSPSAFASLQDVHGLRLAQVAAALLGGQRVFDQSLPSTVPPAPLPGDTPARELVHSSATEAESYVQRDFSGDLRALKDPAERTALQTYFQEWQEAGARALGHALAAGRAAGTTMPQPTLPDVNRSLQQDLHEVAQIESGALWLAGKYRWLEIIFWVWFGVLTQSLVQHGLALTGGRHLEVWQPREFLRTLSKLFYAPALGVAVFFLRDYFSAEQESLDFAYNTPATLGLAFLLGMFPTTAYRLLRRLADTVFRGDIAGSDKTKSIPRTVTVQVNASHRQPGELYRLENLRANVADLYSAPLRN